MYSVRNVGNGDFIVTHDAEEIIVLEYLEWDTRHFSQQTYAIKVKNGTHLNKESIQLALYTLRDIGVRVVYAKVDTECVQANESLLAERFVIYDVNVKLTFKTIDEEVLKPLHVKSVGYIGEVNLNYGSDLQFVQGTFEKSRFRNDRRFSVTKVDEMYTLWVEHFIKNDRGDAFGYFIGEKLVGILLLSYNSDQQESVIELIVVGDEHRSKGIGHELVKQAKIYSHKRKKGYLMVGTQLNNKPAIKFYQKNGFFIKESYFIYHYWFH